MLKLNLHSGYFSVLSDEMGIGNPRNVWNEIRRFDFPVIEGEKVEEKIKRAVLAYQTICQEIGQKIKFKEDGPGFGIIHKIANAIPGYWEWEDAYQKTSRQKLEEVQQQAIYKNEPVEFSRNYVGCGGRLSNIRWVTPEGFLVEGYTTHAGAVSTQTRTNVNFCDVPPQWQEFFENIAGGKYAQAVTV